MGACPFGELGLCFDPCDGGRSTRQVDLFYMPGSRRISLRFLAYHLLGLQMSNRIHDTHDSIEDARTALALYEHYLELQAADGVDEAIQQLYDIGRETSWAVPDA